MRLLAVFAIVVAAAAADTSSWANWNPSAGPTTTITKTLLQVNQTTTMTSYSHSSTGTANLTKSYTNTTTTATYYASTHSPVASNTTAAIATFSAGAATAQGVNGAMAAIVGVGAIAYGLF